MVFHAIRMYSGTAHIIARSRSIEKRQLEIDF
jgi:hypothetical protein